ncbi:MFS transporter [Aquihabitans sp. G128]|uniref:MFS transporter n=1 Tax=Aquihabitans sp. G128 TaxID=2849779 RepID=UPI001C24D3CC|nr:MFS transporter [Aquihabitans sp. G128]QXC59786.1 MFS transporter [Aquihabitans sp. G128]
MHATTDHEIDPAIYNRRWAILAVLCTSLMIVIIGNTSLNVALPTLARELDASTSSLQWMVDAYSLVFAGLLFTAGTLGDRFGRKGALQAGLGVFLLGALVASVADTAAMVIGARAIMGVAAAFVMPSTLSILTNVFPAHERPKAIAIWAGISGGGAAIGPIASGFLLEHFWWGSVFLVNLPIIVIALVAGAFLVPSSKDPDEQPLDIPGALLSIVGLGALVYGIIEGPIKGWGSSQTLGTFALALVALLAFGYRELTARHPMLDLRLFRDRRFSVASGGMTLVFFAMFGTFFLVSQYFQLVLGYSPFKSGLLQLPMAVVMMSIAPQVPKLVARFGAARVVPMGLGLVAIGLAFFSQVDVDSSIWAVYLAILPLAAGMASTMTPLTTLIMSSVPLGKAGVGSAMNDTTRELGGALGVAILGSVVTSRFTSSLGPAVTGLSGQARTVADSGLTGALKVADQLGGQQGAALAAAAKSAFVDGIVAASIVGAVVVISAAVASWFLLPRGSQVPAGAVPGDLLAEEGAAGDLVDEHVLAPSPILD